MKRLCCILLLLAAAQPALAQQQQPAAPSALQQYLYSETGYMPTQPQPQPDPQQPYDTAYVPADVGDEVPADHLNEGVRGMNMY